MKAIVLEMADIGLQVIHTPGHSPGSVSLYWPSEKALFTGDTVFKDGGTNRPSGRRCFGIEK
jgi:glyoxylase-like metal-dependent hydrolase (beta-lactamase superfamily II)